MITRHGYNNISEEQPTIHHYTVKGPGRIGYHHFFDLIADLYLDTWRSYRPTPPVFWLYVRKHSGCGTLTTAFFSLLHLDAWPSEYLSMHWRWAAVCKKGRLWLIHQMNWSHYLVKAVPSYCIWGGFIVDIRVIWPIHVPPWYWTVARCEQNPIKTQQLIHAQIKCVPFGLHWVEVWHLNSELPLRVGGYMKRTKSTGSGLVCFMQFMLQLDHRSQNLVYRMWLGVDRDLLKIGGGGPAVLDC